MLQKDFLYTTDLEQVYRSNNQGGGGVLTPGFKKAEDKPRTPKRKTVITEHQDCDFEWSEAIQTIVKVNAFCS